MRRWAESGGANRNSPQWMGRSVGVTVWQLFAFTLMVRVTDYKQGEIGDSVVIAPRTDFFFLREAFEGCSQSPGQIVLHRCHLPTSLSTKISMCSHVLLFDLLTCLFSERPFNCISWVMLESSSGCRCKCRWIDIQHYPAIAPKTWQGFELCGCPVPKCRICCNGNLQGFVSVILQIQGPASRLGSVSWDRFEVCLVMHGASISKSPQKKDGVFSEPAVHRLKPKLSQNSTKSFLFH